MNMPEENDKNNIIEVTERSVETKLRDFSDLLQDIDSLDDKIRQLWKEIYTYAIEDRQNAYVMFAQLFKLIDNRSAEYAVHGRTLTSCVERMQRANDQLSKLAELIANAKQKDEVVNPDDVFNMIKKKG
jgi:hypothetical protein